LSCSFLSFFLKKAAAGFLQDVWISEYKNYEKLDFPSFHINSAFVVQKLHDRDVCCLFKLLAFHTEKLPGNSNKQAKGFR